jgi:phosphoenolpyruvate-protein phosphotransferase
MKIWKGQAISPGYAEGVAVVYRTGRGVAAVRRRIAPGDSAAEVARFRQAIDQATAELEVLRSSLVDDIGETKAAIFGAHAAILRDPSLRDNVEQRINQDLVNAEHAVEREMEGIAVRFEASQDGYLSERARDIRDLCRRLLAQFSGGVRPELPKLPPDSVLVADELMPSDTVRLDRAHVRAIVTERCGLTSHSAILAKALGIPAVSDIKDVCERIRSGASLLVDGVSGTVVIRPEESETDRFRCLRDSYEEELAAARAEETGACLTRDGVRIELHANLGRVSEATEVRAHALDGVGLFRTEVLFLDHRSPPTFDEQRDTYRQVAEALDGLPLVIRVLDLGGDKHPAFLPEHPEHNPTLGLRGLRFALKEQKLLRTQLSAILDVARHAPVRIMFPMVLGGSALKAAIDILEEVAAQAGVSRRPPVGPMIETPSALFSLDEILAQSDFLSIGTNDLTQFMLAADRDATELIEDYSMLHPSVLRAIRGVVLKAEAAGKPLGVCGEAAGAPDLVSVLVGLGVRSLSMSPSRAPAVRHVLAMLDVAEATEAAEALLECGSLEEIRNRVFAGQNPAT